MYVGTPCQIAGLYGYLDGEKTANLITVDILCHGVPSPGVWKSYLDENFDVEKIQEVKFRGKEWKTHLLVEYNDGNKEYYTKKENAYMQAFLEDVILRKTCYQCQYNCIPRQGDISIGDFWNAYKKDMYLGRDKISIVTLNTDYGARFFFESIAYYKEKVMIEDLSHDDMKMNPALLRPVANVNSIKKRNDFFEKFMEVGFNKAFYNTVRDFKTGIVFYLSSNYGSMATNWSLYSFLKRYDYKPIVLDTLCDPRGEYASKFLSRFERSSLYFRKGDFIELDKTLDTYIVGSDMTWNLKTPGMKNKPEIMMLGFANDSKKKIAYTPSFGAGGKEIDSVKRSLCKYWIKQFDYIAVREKEGADICRELFDISPNVGIDPIFLSDKSFFQSESDDNSFRTDENSFLFAYILNPTSSKRKLIKEIAEKKKLQIVLVLDLEGNQSENQKKMEMDSNIIVPTFSEFCQYLNNSSFVVTDSYHGVCMSLILGKDFVGIKNRSKNRFDNLVNLIPCGKRIFDPLEIENKNVDIYKMLQDNVYTEEVLLSIQKTTSICRKNLLNALEKPKTKDQSLGNANEIIIKLAAEIKKMK